MPIFLSSSRLDEEVVKALAPKASRPHNGRSGSTTTSVVARSWVTILQNIRQAEVGNLRPFGQLLALQAVSSRTRLRNRAAADQFYRSRSEPESRI